MDSKLGLIGLGSGGKQIQECRCAPAAAAAAAAWSLRPCRQVGECTRRPPVRQPRSTTCWLATLPATRPGRNSFLNAADLLAELASLHSVLAR